MLNGLFMLLALSTVMAIASFLAGMLPLSLSLTKSQLRLLTTLGMGVLVGTSLIVIIPEGIDTLYSASAVSTSHHKRAVDTSLSVRIPTAHAPQLWRRDKTDLLNMPGPVIPGGLDSAENNFREPPKTPTQEGVVGIMSENSNGDNSKSRDPPKTPTEPGVVGIMAEETEFEDFHNHQREGRSPHVWVGISLISGFILMYLVDTLPQLAPPSAPSRSNIFTLSDLSSSGGAVSPDQPVKGSFSTTLGLLIHAFADGIALGASSSIPGLSFMVFFAIMIHKAPAAFGLTTVLLRQGLTKRQARVHLAAFSLAAPAGAICTWLLVGLLGGLAGFVEDWMKWLTGFILLFSGGTFLFVAMHTMQEADSDDEETDGQSMDGYLGIDDRGGHRHKSKKSLKLVGAAVVGMIIPAITQVGHAH